MGLEVSDRIDSVQGYFIGIIRTKLNFQSEVEIVISAQIEGINPIVGGGNFRGEDFGVILKPLDIAGRILQDIIVVGTGIAHFQGEGNLPFGKGGLDIGKQKGGNYQ